MSTVERPGAAPAASESDLAVEDLAHLLARTANVRRAAAWDAPLFTPPDLHRAAALVEEKQPRDPAPPPVGQAALDALAEWALSRGARLAPGLRVVAGERGAQLIPAAPIAAGSPLVEVPLALVVRGSQLLAGHPTLGPWLGGEPLFGPGTLMLWLLCARYGGAPDPWCPYVEALPGVVPGTALAWPRSPGAHLVAASLGHRFLAGVLQLYCLVHRRLQRTEAAARPLPLEAFTLQRWLWAGAILSSRQTPIAGELVLVPLWDLLDHDESLAAVSTEAEGERLLCRAAADFPAGQPVAMYYGHHTPASRWVHSGFAPPGPPDGAPAQLPFPLPRETPLRRDKLLWLLSQREIPLEVPIDRGARGEAERRARWYALDADELERLELSSVADAWGQELSLSPPVEARAQEMLREWLLERAGPAAPVAPFSREHAFVLAAAHARYAGLATDTDARVLLDDSDLLRVEAFLARHAATSLLLRARLRRAGLIFSMIEGSGTWAAALEGGEIAGVAMHARDGQIVLQAPDAAEALVRHLRERSGRAVRGLVGPDAQVQAARAALAVGDDALTVVRERIFQLALPALRLDAHEPALVRRATAADLDALVEWRAEARRATIGEAISAEALAALRAAAEAQLAAGALFVAEAEGAPVSTAACAEALPGVIEVTDVLAAPAWRQRGLARDCLAGALLSCRAAGAALALVQLAPGDPAEEIHRALGFEPAGDRTRLTIG